MKRAFLIVVIALIVFIAAVFIFIPSRIIITEVASVECNLPAVKRFIFDEANWSKWLNQDSLTNRSYSQKINNIFYSKTGILISDGAQEFQTDLIVIPFNMDSTGIDWRDTLIIGNNPFTRIRQYNKAIKLKAHMHELILQLTQFLNNKLKVYSINVFGEQIKDRPLLSRRVVLERTPTAEDAYELIESLRVYAKQQGDTTYGPAMKFASELDSSHYELMVAIPTTKMLKETKDYIPKGLVGGNPIATLVTGGEKTIANAWQAIRQYKADYQLSSPAIPYELMITDRTKEKDSSKWITKIIYPTRL